MVIVRKSMIAMTEAHLNASDFACNLDDNLRRLGAHSELCKPKKLPILAKRRQKACCFAHFRDLHSTGTNFARFPLEPKETQEKASLKLGELVSRRNSIEMRELSLIVNSEKNVLVVMMDCSCDRPITTVAPQTPKAELDRAYAPNRRVEILIILPNEKRTIPYIRY